MIRLQKHLIFYDGECGFCNQAVQIILKLDKKEKFAFASLQGKTASNFLKNDSDHLKNIDSIILVENFEESKCKIYLLSSAIFRIFWLIGGVWILVGWLYFLPAYLFDWVYRLIARVRKDLFRQPCFIPTRDQKKRFLP